MLRNFVLEQIIRETKNEISLHAFLHTFGKDGHESLSRNRHLPIGLWNTLVQKAKINVATNLYSRDLSEDQIKIALKDTRVYARRALLCHGVANATEETIDEILAKPWVTDEMLRTWLHYGNNLSAKHRRAASIRVGGSTQIRQLANQDAYPDIEEVISILKNQGYVYSPWDLSPVFEKRVEIMEHLDEKLISQYRVAIANSWNLISEENQWLVYGKDGVQGNIYAWTALMRNPYTKKEIVEKIRSHPKSRSRWQKEFKSLDASWQSAPGEPLTRSVHQLETDSEKERAEYFKKYNSFYRLLPWETSEENRKESVPLSAIKWKEQDQFRAFSRYSTDWAQVDTELGKILTTESNWQAFWSLFETWNGSLQELAETSSRL